MRALIFASSLLSMMTCGLIAFAGNTPATRTSASSASALGDLFANAGANKNLEIQCAGPNELLKKMDAGGYKKLKKMYDICNGVKETASAPDPSADAETQRAARAAAKTAKTRSAAQKKCIDAFQGSTGGECLAYQPHTGAQLKKDANELQEKITTAQKDAVEAEHNYQTQKAELGDQRDQAMLALTSKIPGEKTQADLTAQQGARDAHIALNDQLTSLQSQFNTAQATYQSALSSIRDGCFKKAQDAYATRKAQIAALGVNGKNIASAALTKAQNDLKTYQSRKYEECLSDVSGVEAMKQAESSYQGTVKSLSAALVALNKKQANIGTQLETQLQKINVDEKMKSDTQYQVWQSSTRKLGELEQWHSSQGSTTQNQIANLQKQIDIDRQEEQCIESIAGTSGKGDSDDDDKLEAGATASNELLSYCATVGSTDACNVCNSAGIPQSDIDQIKEQQGSVKPPADTAPGAKDAPPVNSAPTGKPGAKGAKSTDTN